MSRTESKREIPRDEVKQMLLDAVRWARDKKLKRMTDEEIADHQMWSYDHAEDSIRSLVAQGIPEDHARGLIEMARDAGREVSK